MSWSPVTSHQAPGPVLEVVVSLDPGVAWTLASSLLGVGSNGVTVPHLASGAGGSDAHPPERPGHLASGAMCAMCAMCAVCPCGG
jgi:hypothetical protein